MNNYLSLEKYRLEVLLKHKLHRKLLCNHPDIHNVRHQHNDHHSDNCTSEAVVLTLQKLKISECHYHEWLKL